jgi:hypothetical protein
MSSERNWTTTRWIVVGVAALLLAGSLALVRGPAKGTLSGRVTVAGKPVAGGWVVAVSPDGAMRTANVGADGQFNFSAVPQGPVSLAVISPDPARVEQRSKRLATRSDRLAPEDYGAPTAIDRSKWQAVPTRFEDPRASGLTAVVGRSTVFDVVIP